MPSLPQSVASRLEEGRAYPTLGRLIGGDEHDAAAASGVAMAAVVDGLSELARGDGSDEEAADAVVSLLDAHGTGPLDDLDGFLIAGSAGPGNDILDRVFGADRGRVVVGLASRLELGSSVIGRLLPLVAPLVTAELARRRDLDGLDGRGLVGLLEDQRRALEAEGLLGERGGTDVVIDLDREELRGGAAGGPAASAAAIGAEGVGSTGAVATLEDTRTGAGASSGETVAGTGADASSRSASKSDAEVGSTEAGGGSIADVVLGEVGTEASGPMNWLWWAGGAVVLVLVLAWLLSTCNDGSAEEDGATTAVEVADEEEGDAGSGGDTGSGDTTVTAADPEVEAELQALVEAALDGTGVIGETNGTDVTLTGTVGTEEASAEAEAAVGALPGVATVDNRIVVDEAVATGAAGAGETLNDLLGLEPVTFAISSATITAEGQAVLDQAIEYLDGHPEVRVEIGGHTDDDGSEAANLDLSQRRAEAVLAHLTAGGIDPGRLTAKGYGESEPKVPNTSLANKAINRRIEFTVL
jgi:outer membrane protein OmpA-like peptidoglycan-associated protein